MTRCPHCDKPMINWSDSVAGSYGNACASCRVFWQHEDGEWHGRPLDQAHFPQSHRGIPAYRTLVGWVGP